MSDGNSRLGAKEPMIANPVLKPKLATPALVLPSVAILVGLACLAAAVAANMQPSWVLLVLGAAFLLTATTVSQIWLTRVRHLHTWMEKAKEQWKNFDEAKRIHGTTAEISVLSVDALEPTGSWITIKWNRFDHIQAAWLEALSEPIWPGSVLLISPDAAQIMPGAPWPATYYVVASDCLAWAPEAARESLADTRYHASDRLRLPRL
ncbi:hypothetical protein ABIE00_003020 [Arthrobacter sp. OAP107]